MKIFSTFFIFLFFSILPTKVYSQVGIGTTSPDPSAILDIVSTTQGMLTPRMTTAQRIAITTPAEGLLVFDTNEDAFYYFDSSVWVKLEGAVTRDNYKLVKSIADLADELTAGGGSSYLLSSNYLYEINGTILVDFPIELNSAFITGEDGLEDVLFNVSGGTLFTGSTGGNLKRINVVGNGQQIFDITGTGTENVVCNAVNFIGASSIGNLSTLNLVFFNTGQFINNTTGLNVTDVTSYFMTLFTWATNNVGTFLTLSGTFDEIQLSNSRVNVDAGETGVNVSGNPTITGDASIVQVSFEGVGTLVNGYTIGSYIGYNFSNEWFVQSQGLLTETDQAATGSIYVTSTAATNVSASNTPIKIAGVTTNVNLLRASMSADNRITYLGSQTRFFKYNASISVTSEGSNNTYNFYVYKNGITQLIESKQSRKISNGADVGSISISGVVELNTNDFLEVWVENTTNGQDITAESMNFLMN